MKNKIKLEYDPNTETLTVLGSGRIKNFAIEDNKEWNDLKIKKIVIEEGITAIGDFAFINNSVNEVSFPKSLIKVGRYAFYNSKILDLNLNQLEDIGEYAFANTRIEKIKFSKKLRHIKCGVFSGCKLLKSVDLPINIKEIGDYAFFKCTSLIEVKLRNIKMGSHCFDGCTSLKKLETTNIKEIPPYAFKNNDLQFVKLKGVNEIKKGAFEFNRNLEKISLPSSEANVSKFAFRGCSINNKLNDIVIKKKTKK